MTLSKPFLPPCFLHWTETGGDGEDVLRLVSWRRSLTLKGAAFRAFEDEVLPLLTGALDVDAICARVAHRFARDEVVAALDLLAEQGLIVEGSGMTDEERGMARAPQTGWLSETAPEGVRAQKRVARAHVALFGAGAHGAVAARSLVAAGVGRLMIVDPAEVSPADPYFSSAFDAARIGANRAEALAGALGGAAGATQIAAHGARPETPEALTELIEDATLVLCCLSSGELSLALALNAACRAAGTPWIAASLEGTEVVVGPGFSHGAGGPCYLCWRMREVAAAANPESRYALESHMASVKTDLSARRENLAPAADIAGGMLAAEALAMLSGAGPFTLDGRFVTLTLPGLRPEKHTVLRKPGCPVCGAAPG